MTDSRLLKYQSLLLERPVTKLKVCKNLNPATFLPEKENKTPDHDCSQFLTLNYAARKDLKDKLLGLRNTPLFVNERLPVVDVPTPKKKDFLQVCKYLRQQSHTMPLLHLMTTTNPKMDWCNTLYFNYGHNVTFNNSGCFVLAVCSLHL